MRDVNDIDSILAVTNTDSQNWMLSHLHGEQGALMCTARIVETVPWIDAKYYASTQVMDEARHVEVFSKYRCDRFRALGGHGQRAGGGLSVFAVVRPR